MKGTFLIICLVLCNSVIGQVRYKVEYDYDLNANFPSSGATSSIEVYVTARLENGSSDSNFLNAVFSSPGNTNRKKDEVLQYSSKIKSFDVLHFVSSGNPTCLNNGDTKSFSFSGSECSFLPFATSNNNDCFFFQQIGLQKLFPLEDFESLNPNFFKVIPECKKRSVLVSNYCDFSYKVEARFGGNPPITILPYGEKSGSFDFELTDIDGLKLNELFEIRIVYAENPSANEISKWISSSFVGCSIELRDNNSIQATNTTCNGNNDGSVILNFKEDVGPGYEMRYYIYEGDPSSFPSGEETNQNPDNPLVFPQTVDNVRFSDGPSPNQVGPLKSNNDGTFRGQSKKSLGEGTYYVLYQEVRYNYPNDGDVDVKSGELIPDSFTIEQPSKIIPSAIITQAQCNENTAQINFSASGGDNLDSSGTYSFQYQLNGDGNWITASANPQNIPLSSSEQTVQIKATYSVGPCESDIVTLLDKIEAIVPSLIFTNPSSGIASSSSASNGVISINYDGGTPNYTFELSKQNEVSSVFETVSDPTIIDNPLSKRVEFRNLGIGTYRITIADKNGLGCSLTTESLGDIVVGTTPLPVLGDEEVIPISCTNANSGVVSVNVSGGATPYNYQWTINGIVSPIQTTGVAFISLNNLSEPGEYILKVASNGFTDFDNASGYAITTLTLDSPGQVSIENTTITNISCNGAQDGNILIAASGGTNYEYKLDAFDNWQDLNGNTIPITVGGVYDLYLRNSENGCEAVPIIDALLIEEPDPIDVLGSLYNATTNDGFEGSISLVISGGTPFASVLNPYSISWTKEKEGNVTIFEDTGLSNPYDITDLEAAIYQATIIDANGCVLSRTFEITEPGELSVTINQSVFLECHGNDFGEITALIQGGATPYRLEWFQTVNGFNNLLQEDSEIIGNLSEGTYFLRVTDANDVISISTPLAIVEPDALEIIVENIWDVLCDAEATGAIEISVVGGTAPYSYSWSNGASTQDLLNVVAGDYNLNVVDANGCLAEIDVAVNAAPEAIGIEGSTVTDVSAYLANDGSITLDISGGATPYTINWVRVSDNAIMGNENIIANLPADSYHVTISDANGCTVGETYEVTQPDIVVETIEQPTCGGDDDGSITVLVNQGNGTFTYEWNTGAITNSISGLASGSYIVTVTGLEDGPITRTYVLEDPKPISVDIGPDRTLCAGQQLLLNATVADETAIYSWRSDRGFSSRSPQVSISETGNYTVSVITSNGCTAEETIFVDSSLDEINAEFAVSSQVFVNENFVAVDISYPLPDSIEWVLPEEATIFKKDSDEVELHFDVAGEYEIELITTKGSCIAQKAKKIIVVEPDGVFAKEDIKNGRKQIVDFVIHPNPTNGIFTAQVRLSDSGNLSIKIFNFANNALVAHKEDREKKEYAVPFDITGVPSGVYVVLLETPYGNTVRKIVIK